MCVSPTVAQAAPAVRVGAVAEDSIVIAIRAEAGGALRRFYAARGYRPLWVSGGKAGPAADRLIGFLATAELDGLKPYDVDGLRAAIAAARGGDAQPAARAELALSAAFARYVRDQRGARAARMTYADKRLKPKKPGVETVLRAAAFPKSFDDYVAGMDWMSDQYVRLRKLTAAARKQGASGEEMARLRRNLDRARLLPGPWTRHVVVDASSGRLWYYEAGRQVGTMRVVVGAAETQTPMLAGTLQWAILNPYWNVPDYLVRKSIAAKVLAGRTLDSLHMEALSDWGANPRRIEPGQIDWRAVAAGKEEVRLRELPGGANSMGKVKFLFPNRDGIYLHDTPVRDLLKKDDRHFSNGCIRLEDADALGKWLLQKPLGAASKEPEQAVALPVQVPVYLTYITAAATDRGVAFRDDVYGRDGRG
nr:L,D-transpeptidase family protein [Sphingomonas sp. dw_22]